MPAKKTTPKSKYFFAKGGRKSAHAWVKLTPGKGKFIINKKEVDNVPAIYLEPFKITGEKDKFDVLAGVTGGGITSQPEAIRLAISRALYKYNPEYKSSLRKAGLVSRDPRKKERKKPGLKRARKAPQWAKR